MTQAHVVVNKSTVTVGTGEKVRRATKRRLTQRGVRNPFSPVSNPEFLKKVDAISDFMRPDRIVIGAEEPGAIKLTQRVCAPFNRNRTELTLKDIHSAQLTKYAANAMLATRIRFMNEMALLCEHVGTDMEQIRRGMAADPRIGWQFLYAGCGYGSPCFPEDVKAVLRTAQSFAIDLQVISAFERANEAQKDVLVRKIQQRLGNHLRGVRFAVWGLAFKPGTNDMRKAPSLVLIEELLRHGTAAIGYDPVAQTKASGPLKQTDRRTFADKAQHTVEGADALVIMTERNEFRSPDFKLLHSSKRQPLIFAGRNTFDTAQA